MESQNYNRLYLHIVLWTTSETAEAGFLCESAAQDLLTSILEDPSTPLIHSAILRDHLHLLLYLPTDKQPQSWTRWFKSAFSKQLNACLKSDKRFYWAPGCRMYSVSPNRLSRVESYLRKQEDFHRVVSFKDEMQQLDSTCQESLQVMERRMRFGRT